jgi:hypothetical protein
MKTEDVISLAERIYIANVVDATNTRAKENAEIAIEQAQIFYQVLRQMTSSPEVE